MKIKHEAKFNRMPSRHSEDYGNNHERVQRESKVILYLYGTEGQCQDKPTVQAGHTERKISYAIIGCHLDDIRKDECLCGLAAERHRRKATVGK